MKLVAAGALAPDISLSTTSPVTSVIDSVAHQTSGHVYCLLQNSGLHPPTAPTATGRPLATMNDATENHWLLLLWCGARSLWIRFNDAEAEGGLVWRSGIRSCLLLGGLPLLNPAMEFQLVYA
jgi:hypothetical protein